MKFLLVLVVVVVGLWLLLRDRSGGPGKTAPRKPAAAPTPAPMLACAHCGLHLPGNEALTDAAGRPFCSDAHRVAGPR